MKNWLIQPSLCTELCEAPSDRTSEDLTGQVDAVAQQCVCVFCVCGVCDIKGLALLELVSHQVWCGGVPGTRETGKGAEEEEEEERKIPP